MELKSDAFQDGDQLPREFTCDGPGVSPPLYWVEPPQGRRAYALILDDPDAPSGVFTHWLIYNLPGDHTRLQLAVPQVDEMTTGVLQGKNSSGSLGYAPPCPPPGSRPHHYRFTVYALDQSLDLRGGADRQQVEQAMQGHVLAQARLVGMFARPGRRQHA